MRPLVAAFLLGTASFQHCLSPVSAAGPETLPRAAAHRNDSRFSHRFVARRLAEHIKHHSSCALNEGVENVFVLESHHGKGAHGDVCRDPVSGDFHCPTGCRTSHVAPYCLERATQVLELASPLGASARHKPCRVVADDDGPGRGEGGPGSHGQGSGDIPRAGAANNDPRELSNPAPGAGRSSILGRLGSRRGSVIPAGVAVRVANLPPGITGADLRELFATVGELVAPPTLDPPNTDGSGSTGASALVVFAARAGALEAVAQFHTRTLDGWPMEVGLAVPAEVPGGPTASAGGRALGPPPHRGAASPAAVAEPAAGPVAVKSNIPIFASPVLMFNREGLRFADGDAPAKPDLFFPSLTSARWVDPLVDIYLLTNFQPHASDGAELSRLGVTLMDADACLAHPKVKATYDAFSKPCPIGGKGGALGGSGIVGVTRFFALQGAMELLNLDMVFFLEGDNLLLRPVSFLATAYQLKEHQIDATITHISFHASFFSRDFLAALNQQARLFADFTTKFLTPGECFLTGGGQDMRLGYEGARMLQVHRHLHPADGKTDARILNTAGGTVPCRLVPRRWVNSLGLYCNRSKDTAGPCALEQPLQYFNENNGHMWTATNAKYLPKLYECDPRSVAEASEGRIPGSLQQNLKGSSVKQSPSECTSTSRELCEGSPTDHVKLSQTFYCDEEWVKANPAEQNNKALSFRGGRAYSMVPGGGWVEHFNLHFQGGGCKAQMATVFAAVRRSAQPESLGFTCEKTDSLAAHEQCMRTGVGATGSMHGSPP